MQVYQSGSTALHLKRGDMVPKRVGILIPSTNTTVEADFQRLLSEAVTVHSERLYIPDGTMTEEFLDQMNQDLLGKATLLASARVDVIAYACTSGSFYRGAGWDAQVKSLIEQHLDLPCITTSTAVFQAFQALNVDTVSVTTPYPDWTNQKLLEYYTAHGLNVLGVHGDTRAAVNGHRAVNDQEPEQIHQFSRDHFDHGAQVLFCSCTAWRALECAPQLEIEVGVPVVTSNQATIWAALHALDGIAHARPAGRLFTVSPRP